MGLAADTYTFLFTDIAGSTSLMLSAQSAMLAAVERHDEIARPVLESHGGHVFKAAGDGFLTAYSSPVAALRAAVRFQQMLEGEPWGLPQSLRVRMALHTGSVQKRGEDYFGLAISHAARLLEIAHGGQILLTEATQVCVREAMPDGVALRGLGAVRLRSLERAEPIYQALAEGLDENFPVLRSGEATPHNLKDPMTSFIGREQELADVRTLCRTRRLITLTGAGGCGKTRLAQQAAQDLFQDFPDGIWLVELGGLTDPALAAAAVAAALKVRQQGAQPLEEAITEFLRSRRLLIILDNCEHVVDVCALLAQTLLTSVPCLTILATSRERLHLHGECTWSLPPLTPPGAEGATVESVLASSAGALFVERASAATAQFRLTPANAPVVAQICRRLDGLPLALELAAAWARTLTAEQIAARLDQQLRLPPGRGNSLAERHRTVQATLDWSFGLLTEPEQALLCRLALFAGGWTLEAAETVCSGTGIEPFDVLDVLSRLVDKSLVWPEEQDGAARYRMLEILRAYSLDKLRASADLDAWQARHAACFLAWAESAEPQWQGDEGKTWLDDTERDHDNLTAAL